MHHVRQIFTFVPFIQRIFSNWLEERGLLKSFRQFYRATSSRSMPICVKVLSTVFRPPVKNEDTPLVLWWSEDDARATRFFRVLLAILFSVFVDAFAFKHSFAVLDIIKFCSASSAGIIFCPGRLSLPARLAALEVAREACSTIDSLNVIHLKFLHLLRILLLAERLDLELHVLAHPGVHTIGHVILTFTEALHCDLHLIALKCRLVDLIADHGVSYSPGLNELFEVLAHILIRQSLQNRLCTPVHLLKLNNVLLDFSLVDLIHCLRRWNAL